MWALEGGASLVSAYRCEQVEVGDRQGTLKMPKMAATMKKVVADVSLTIHKLAQNTSRIIELKE